MAAVLGLQVDRGRPVELGEHYRVGALQVQPQARDAQAGEQDAAVAVLELVDGFRALVGVLAACERHRIVVGELLIVALDNALVVGEQHDLALAVGV